MPTMGSSEANGDSGTTIRHARAARWMLRLVAATLVAALVASFAGSAGFGERLWALTWQTPLSNAEDSSSAELEFKMKLAEQKYGRDAERVFESYGSDEAFHQVLRDHGEHVIPIIAFFMDTDLRSMRAQYGLSRLWISLKEFWPGRAKTNELPSIEEYSPYYRGLYAIDRANQEGHDFLGQFDVHEKKARWNQTARFSKAVTEFLLDGIQTVETKRNNGAHVTAWDWAYAGSDVLVVFSASKLMKLPKVMSTATQSTARVGAMGRALGSNTIAHTLLRHSARAGTAYLIATNPNLLTGLFVDIATAFDVPAWWVVTAGWFIVILLLSFLLLPLLAAASLLIPVIKLISQAARWLQPMPRIFGRGAAPSKTRSG